MSYHLALENERALRAEAADDFRAFEDWRKRRRSQVRRAVVGFVLAAALSAVVVLLGGPAK